MNKNVHSQLQAPLNSREKKWDPQNIKWDPNVGNGFLQVPYSTLSCVWHFPKSKICKITSFHINGQGQQGRPTDSGGFRVDRCEGREAKHTTGAWNSSGAHTGASVLSLLPCLTLGGQFCPRGQHEPHRNQSLAKALLHTLTEVWSSTKQSPPWAIWKHLFITNF